MKACKKHKVPLCDFWQSAADVAYYAILKKKRERKKAVVKIIYWQNIMIINFGLYIKENT